MVVVKYPCKQLELIVVAQVMWGNFRTYNDAFSSKKGLYNPPYLADRMAEVDAAQKIDDDSVRKSKVSARLYFLEKVAQKGRNKWQDLKSYIETGWKSDVELIPIKCQEAGGDYYPEASDKNWKATENLLKTGVTFISENKVALELGNNMPASFIEEFTNVDNEYGEAMKAFYDEEENARINGNSKVEAYNLVYKKLVGICNDGQKYFRDDAKLRELFVFDSALELVRSKMASLKGGVTTNVLHDDLLGFELLILENDELVKSESDGKYNFGSLAAATYTVICSKEGYITQTISNVKVETGVAKTLNVEMKKA